MIHQNTHLILNISKHMHDTCACVCKAVDMVSLRMAALKVNMMLLLIKISDFRHPAANWALKLVGLRLAS